MIDSEDSESVTEKYKNWSWQYAGYGSPAFRIVGEKAKAEGRTPMQDVDLIDEVYEFLENWCRENIKGQWILEPTLNAFFLFEDHSDGMLFKLANC